MREKNRIEKNIPAFVGASGTRRSDPERTRFIRLNMSLAVLLAVFMLLVSVNTALAWLSDEDMIANDMSLGKIEAPTYAAVVRAEGGDDLSLVFGRGELSIDGAEVLESFYDFIDADTSEGVPWSDYVCDIKAVVFKDVVRPKSTDRWFEGAKDLTQILSIENLDMSRTESSRAMFKDCARLESIDISMCNAIALKDMASMFEGCASLKSLNLEGVSGQDLSGSYPGFEGTTFCIFKGCERLERISVSPGFAFTATDSDHALQYPDPEIIPDADGYWYASGTSLPMTPESASNYINSNIGGDPITLCAFGPGYASVYGGTILVFGRGIPSDTYKGLTLDATYHGIETGDGDFDPNATSYYRNQPWQNYGLQKVESIAVHKIKTPSIKYWFYMKQTLVSVDMSSIEFSECRDLSYAFFGCNRLVDLDVSDWDTHSVASLRYAFNNCKSLEALDVSRWDTSNLGKQAFSFEGAFAACEKLKQIDTSKWKVDMVDEYFRNASKVSNTMFYGCSSLESLDLSGFTVPERFSGKDQGNENWWDFSGCVSLEKLVVSSAFCIGNNRLPTPNPNRNGIVNSYYWYESRQGSSMTGNDVCQRIRELYRGDVDSPAITTFYSSKDFTDEDSYAAYYVSPQGGDKTLVFSRGSVVPERYGDGSLSNVYREIETRCGGSKTAVPWNTINSNVSEVRIDADISPHDCAYWFDGFVNNRGFAGLERFSMKDCISVSNMYSRNYKLETLDLRDLDFSSCQSFVSMFDNCSELRNLQVSGWRFSDALTEKSFESMFYGCSSLEELDMDTWVISQRFGSDKRFSFSNTFGYCHSLKKIYFPHLAEGSNPVSGSVSSPYYFGGTFYQCGALEEIVVPNDFAFATELIPAGNSSFDNIVNAGRWYENMQGEPFSPSRLQEDLLSRFRNGSEPSHWYIRKHFAQEDAYAALYGDKLVFGRGDSIPSDFNGNALDYGYREVESADFKPAWWGNERSVNTTIKSVIFDVGLHPKTLNRWFASLSALESICGLDRLDTSEVSDFAYLFYSCGSLTSLDVSSFDMKSSKDLRCMFSNCTDLEVLDLFDLIANKDSYLYRLFSGCNSLKKLDLSSWSMNGWTNTNATSGIFDSCGLEEVVLPPSFSFSVVENGSGEYGRTFARSYINRQDYIVANCWYENGYGRPYSYFDIGKAINERCGSKSESTRWTRYPVEDAYAAVYKDSYSSDLSLEFGRGNLDALSDRYADKTLRGIVLGFEYYDWIALDIYNVPWIKSFDAANYKSVRVSDAVSCVSLDNWFNGFRSCTVFDLSRLDTSKATSMICVFKDCQAVEELDLTGWDTSSMTSIGASVPNYAPFYSCLSLKRLNISTWDFSAAASSAQHMFTNCPYLEEIDMSGCVYENAPTLTYQCPNIKRVLISPSMSFQGSFFEVASDALMGYDGNWYTEDTRTRYTLDEARALVNERYGTTNEPICFIAGYGTSPYAAVYKDPYSSDCKLVFGRGFAEDGLGAYELELVCRDIEKVAYNSYGTPPSSSAVPWFAMRKDISEVIDMVPSDDPIKAISLNGWFCEMEKLQALDLSMFDVSHVTDISFLLYGCTSLSDLQGLASWSTSKIEHMDYALAGPKADFSDAIRAWDTSALKSMDWAFWNCKGLISLDISGWNMASLVSNVNAFYQCIALKVLELPSDFVKSSMTSIGQMFLECRSLESLDVTGWDISGLKDLDRAFYNCVSLTDIAGIEMWDTSSVASMVETFKDCASLNIDCTNWDVSQVIDHDGFSDGASAMLIEPVWKDDGIEASSEDEGLAIRDRQRSDIAGNGEQSSPDQGSAEDEFVFDEDARPISQDSLQVASYAKRAVMQLIFRVNLFTGEVYSLGFFR